jgi:hypothetical protein
MWNDNCRERDAYGELVLTKEEYISQNEAFLRDKFWTFEVEDWTDNGGVGDNANSEV